MENKTKLQKLDRKETEKSKKTKELIYSTAIYLFQKESYEKATMRNLPACSRPFAMF